MVNHAEIEKMVDKAIKSEKIDVRGCDLSWVRVEMKLPYCSPERLAFQFADRWARLMQSMLKSAKMDYLTPELVANSMQRAAVNRHMTKEIYQKAAKFLVEHWIHGVELGNKIGFNPNIIYEWRLACQNNQRGEKTNTSTHTTGSTTDHTTSKRVNAFSDTTYKTSLYEKVSAFKDFDSKQKIITVFKQIFKDNTEKQRG